MSSDPPDPPGQPPFAVSGMGWEDPGPEHPFEAEARGRYERGPLLGQGGMGRVYGARDQRLAREVAIKVLRGDDPELERRMAREASVTARLEHPGIVPVYDAGRGPDGRLFYTMARIQGETLEHAIRSADSADARRLLIRPLLTACEAMAHAHARGVLHRDLKPSNIMLGEHGATLVVDWGLAKELDAPAAVDDLGGETVQGAVLGTPAFMSPEQARGQTLTRASDVWSLGAVLHAVLTGAAPFQGDSASDVLRQVQVGEPPKLDETVPAELRAIVERAMAPQPHDRYPDAGALAQDLARYLDGRRVQAHAYTPAERASRAIVAWRLPLTAAALGLVGVAGIAGWAWWQASQAADAASRARDELLALQAESNANLQSALVNQAVLALERDARAEAEVLAASALLLHGSEEQDVLARGVLAAWGERPRPELVFEAKLPEGCSPILSPDLERVVCVGENEIHGYTLPEMTVAWTHQAALARVSQWNRRALMVEPKFSSESSLLDLRSGAPLPARLGKSNTLRIATSDSEATGAAFASPTAISGHVESGWRPGERPCPEGVRITTLTVAHDDLILVACRGSLQAAEPGGPYAPLSGSLLSSWSAQVNSAWSASFSPGSHIAALGTLEGWVEVIDVDSGRSLGARHLGEGMVERVAVDGDHKRVAMTIERGGTLVWSWDTDQVTRLPGHARSVQWADGVLYTADADTVRAWRLPTHQLPARIRVDGGVTSVSLDPSGELLGLTVGDSLGVRRGAEPDLLPWHLPLPRSVIKDGAFSHDGARFYAIQADAHATDGLHVVDTESGELLAELDGPAVGRRVGTLRNDMVWALPWGRGPHVWSRGELLPNLQVTGSVFHDGESNHSGSAAVLLETTSETLYRLISEPAPALEAVWRPEVMPRAVDITDAGDRLVLLHSDSLELVDLTTQSVIWSVPAPTGGQDVAISPGDKRIATSDVAGHARVWDLETGALLAVMSGHSERVYCVEFSPDGRWLLTGSWDDTVRIWDMSGLDADPQEVLDRVTAQWAMTLHDALALGR